MCVFAEDFIGFYLYLFDLIISDLIPFSIMLIGTLLSMNHLNTQKRKIQSNNFKRESNFIKSVLIMDSFFIIFYKPCSLVNI